MPEWTALVSDNWAWARLVPFQPVSEKDAHPARRTPRFTTSWRDRDSPGEEGSKKESPTAVAGLPTVTLSPEPSSRQSHPQEKWLSLARPGQQNGGHYEEHQISVRNRTQFALAF